MTALRVRRGVAALLTGALAAGGLAIAQAAPASSDVLAASGEKVVEWGQQGDTNFERELTAPVGTSFTHVGGYGSSFEAASIALTDAGTLVTSGASATLHEVPAALAGGGVTSLAPGGPELATAVKGGELSIWGFSGASVPGRDQAPELSNAVKGKANTYFGIALLDDGTVQVWGGEPGGSNGLLNIPEGLTDVTDVALVSGVAAALKSDGSVVIWGTGSPTVDLEGEKVTTLVGSGDGTFLGTGFVFITESGGLLSAGSVTLPTGDYADERFVEYAFNRNQWAGVTVDGRLIGQDKRSGAVGVPESLDGARIVDIAAGGGHIAAIVSSEPLPEPEFEVDTPSTLSGTPEVGETLTGTPATFTLPPFNVSTLWVVDGAPVAQGDTPLELTEEHLGKEIVFRTMGLYITEGGDQVGPIESDSDPVVVEEASGPVFEVVEPSTISGDVAVGETLTGTPATFTLPPFNATPIWLIDGVPSVPGTTLELTEDHMGKEIVFRTMGLYLTEGGDQIGPIESDSEPVTVPGFEVVEPSSFEGIPVTGQTLTAVPATFTMPPFNVTAAWLVDGAIVGTGPTFELTADHVGKEVALRTMGLYLKADSSQILVESDSPAQVVRDVLAVAADGDAVIDGDPVVSSELTATPATFNDTSDDVAVNGQWMRDGAPIDGETGTTYTLTRDDLGADISYVSTATRFEGEDPVTSTSNVIGDIAMPPLVITGKPLIEGNPFIGETLTVDEADFNDDALTATFQWLVDGTPIPDANGTEYEVRPEDDGLPITVVQTVARNGATEAGPDFAQSESDPKAARPAPVDLTVVEDAGISGNRIVGQELTGVPATFSDTEEAVVTNYWVINGERQEADGTTLLLTEDHVGATIRFVSVAEREVDDASLESLSEDAVGPVLAQLATASEVAISGEAKVGKTLTATPATFTGDEAVISGTWLIDGAAVEHDGLTFALTEEHEGKVIGYTSTATRTVDGIEETASSTAETDTVAEADPVTPPDGDGDGGGDTPTPPGDGDSAELERPIVVGSSTVQSGDTITIDLGAEWAGKQVTVMLFSTPTNLGTHTVGADGRLTVQIPASVPVGQHTLAVYDAANGELIAWQTVTVVDGATAAYTRPGGTLGNTGAQTPEYLAPLGVAILLAGAVALTAGVRRRQRLS